MLDKLLDGVLWIIRVIRNRPKLTVEYASLGGRSKAGPPGKLTVCWSYRVAITNLSQVDALELAVVRTTNPQLVTLGVHHIKGLERLEIKRQIEKDLEKDAVVAAHHDFHGALEPPELKELILILRYKSSSGITCYTEYVRSRRDNPNAWSFREPKR